MASRFKLGDRVRPVDGGPVMHVKEFDKQGRVVCSWYVAHEGWQRKTYDDKALQRVGKSRSAER